MQQITIGIGHQNFMLAVRREMGRPANDAIAFCSGRRMDFEVGSELARIAQALRKDAIYSGWDSMSATVPLGFTVVYRELLTVDVIDRVVPFAANDDAPLLFVSTRADEHFGVDRRGSLVRVAGKPRNIGAGRKRAMQRIRATAATMGDELLTDNRFVPFGGECVEPDVPVGTVVRFG